MNSGSLDCIILNILPPLLQRYVICDNLIDILISTAISQLPKNLTTTTGYAYRQL